MRIGPEYCCYPRHDTQFSIIQIYIRPKGRWGDDIKMDLQEVGCGGEDLQEVGCGGEDWIELA